MSTESRIEARDAKAAGGVVAEASEELEILMDALARGQILTVRSTGRHMKALLRTLLDALTAAQAREAGLWSAKALPTPEEQDRLFEAWTHEWADCANPVRTHGPLWRYLSGRWSGHLSAPTPEAPDHD